MVKFKDAKDQEWDVEFDAFVLEEIHRETGIDLADISAGGWEAIENERTLGRVMAVVCGQPFDREFARRIRRNAIGRARAALEAAAADFFQPEKWSKIQSNLELRSKTAEGLEAAETLATIMPLAKVFRDLPPEIRKKIAKEEGVDITELAALEAFASATGPPDTPSRPATDSPDSAESRPEG